MVLIVDTNALLSINIVCPVINLIVGPGMMHATGGSAVVAKKMGKTDIPLLLRFTSAKGHDSVSFLVSFHELEKHMPAVSTTTNMCLDSAMGNYPTYRILRKICA